MSHTWPDDWYRAAPIFLQTIAKWSRIVKRTTKNAFAVVDAPERESNVVRARLRFLGLDCFA
jgi:hypothetical protein